MSQSNSDLWKLVIESRLLSDERAQQLQSECGNVKDAAQQGNAATLAQWLISRNVLSSYQAAILQAGRPGPFFYGDYKVQARIDQGQLAGLFRAVHASTNYPVLLNFATAPANDDANWWPNLAALAQRHCEIVHPSLSRCYEVVDLTSFRFLVNEELSGQPLNERLPEGKKVKVPDACRVVRFASLALVEMHRAGLVHGDIRPDNLWFGSGGSVKLARDPFRPPEPIAVQQEDLGSADWLTRADYMAPELGQPERAPDSLSDIYALGCTLYRLLTGRTPFAGGDVSAKLRRHATEPIQPPEEFGVPESLAKIVAFMMAKNSAVRFQDAGIIAEQLAEFVDPGQLSVVTPVASPTQLAYEGWLKQNRRSNFPPSDEAPAAATVAAASVPNSETSPSPVPASSTLPGSLTVPGPLTVPGSSTLPGSSTPGPTSSVAAAAAAFHESAAAGVVPQIDVTVATSGRSPTSFVSTGGPSSSVTQRLRDRRRTKKNMFLIRSGLLGAAAIAGVLLFALSKMQSGPSSLGVATSSQTPDDGADSVTKSEQSDQDSQQGNGPNSQSFIEVPDDGTTLWSSPTKGSPIDFAFVPRSVRMLLIARTAEMLGSAEGSLVLQALGPRFDVALKSWQRAAGVSLEQIEQLIVGLHDNPEGIPHVSFVVRLADQITEPTLVRGWGSPSRSFLPDRSTSIFVTDDGWAFFVPRETSTEAGSPVRLFVMSSDTDLLTEVAQRGPAPPTMIRSMKNLCDSTDDQRHVSLVFSRTHLFNDEFQGLYRGSLQQLMEPLRSLLWRDNLNSGMLSMHFGQQSFVEVSLQSDTSKDALDLSKEVGDLIVEIPQQIEDYVKLLDPHPYWRDVWYRYPQQIWAVFDQLRFAQEGSQVVLNAWLPGPATHNLIAGTELVMSTEPGQTYQPQRPLEDKPAPKTIEQLLAAPFSVQIDSDDMIRVMEIIQSGVQSTYRDVPFEFKIEILGTDLQLEGITQNQRVNDFKMEGSLADILTGVVMKANPDKTVKASSEPKQMLIWVVAPDPATGQKMVFITTRTAAEKKQFQLPEPFQPNQT